MLGLEKDFALQSYAYERTERSRNRRLPADFVPGKHSVICGRGKACFKSAGNQNLKALVISSLKQYSEARNKIHKSSIVSGIIAQIKKKTPEGAFIKQEHGLWWEVDDSFARDKIGCLFRDCLHTQYRSSTKAKLARKKARRNHFMGAEGSVNSSSNHSYVSYASLSNNSNHSYASSCSYGASTVKSSGNTTTSYTASTTEPTSLAPGMYRYGVPAIMGSMQHHQRQSNMVSDTNPFLPLLWQAPPVTRYTTSCCLPSGGGGGIVPPNQSNQHLPQHQFIRPQRRDFLRNFVPPPLPVGESLNKAVAAASNTKQHIPLSALLEACDTREDHYERGDESSGFDDEFPDDISEMFVDDESYPFVCGSAS
jgi:hypothetical protein